MEALGPIIGWFAPILSTIIITAATASINSHIKRHEQIAEERNAKTEEKRKAEAEWRERMECRMEEIERYMSEQDKKLDALTDATQTTMRTSMLHYIEKYLTRGWITPEERASLIDMHNKYAALNANGFIDGYMNRIAKLPDREI